MVYLTCAGRGVIKTWTEVAARVRLYMLTSDLTSLVPPQFSHRLQVRKVGTVISFFCYYYFFYNGELQPTSFSYFVHSCCTGTSRKQTMPNNTPVESGH